MKPLLIIIFALIFTNGHSQDYNIVGIVSNNTLYALDESNVVEMNPGEEFQFYCSSTVISDQISIGITDPVNLLSCMYTTDTDALGYFTFPATGQFINEKITIPSEGVFLFVFNNSQKITVKSMEFTSGTNFENPVLDTPFEIELDPITELDPAIAFATFQQMAVNTGGIDETIDPALIIQGQSNFIEKLAFRISNNPPATGKVLSVTYHVGVCAVAVAATAGTAGAGAGSLLLCTPLVADGAELFSHIWINHRVSEGKMDSKTGEVLKSSISISAAVIPAVVTLGTSGPDPELVLLAFDAVDFSYNMFHGTAELIEAIEIESNDNNKSIKTTWVHPEDPNEVVVVILNVETENTITPNFTATPQNGNIDLEVLFEDISLVSGTEISSWQWDFNGDGIIDSNLPNPSYIYNTVGSYTVSLTVSDGVINETKTVNNYINVAEPVAGHDLALINLNIDDEWGNPGSSINFSFDIRNYGEVTESNYTIFYQLKDQLGNVVAEDSETGSDIEADELIARFDRSLDTPSNLADNFYTLNCTVALTTDYAQGNNSQENSIYIGNSNPFTTYSFDDGIMLDQGNTVNLPNSDYSAYLIIHDDNTARITITKNSGGFTKTKYCSKGELVMYDADQLMIQYESSFGSNEIYIRFGFPSQQVSFSPQNITIEACKKGTIDIITDVADPTPNIEVFNDGSIDAPIVELWNMNAYVMGTPYTNAYLDIEVPCNAERRDYEFWIKLDKTGDDFLQKLIIDVVDPLPDFTFQTSTNNLNLASGITGETEITFSPEYGFNENVVINTEGLPDGVSCNLSQNNFQIPATINAVFEVDESFSAFDFYPVTLFFSSNTRTKMQIIYLNIIDATQNFATINSVEYIDSDNRITTLKINYNAQFSFAPEAITSNWQYKLEEGDWTEIPESQIFNNQSKPQGESYIIWEIPDNPIMFSLNSKFRMKLKNGEDFLSNLGHTTIGQPSYNRDFAGLYIENGILYVVDFKDAPVKLRKYDIENNYNYLGYHNLSAVSLSQNIQMAKCYDRYYFVNKVEHKAWIYDNNFNYFTTSTINNEIDVIYEKDEILYAYANENNNESILTLSDLALENSRVPSPYTNRAYYAFSAGNNIWIGEDTDLHKISEDLQSFEEYYFYIYIEAGAYVYNNILYATNGTDEIYKGSFYDPYSFYSESAYFEINNTATQELLEIPTLISDEDIEIINAITLSNYVSDEDTPIEQLNFVIKNIDEGIYPVYIPETSTINLGLEPNWHGSSSFVIEVSDEYNTSEMDVEVNISPVNDQPILLAEQIQMVEDVDWSIDTILLVQDVDNLLSEVTVTITEIGSLGLQITYGEELLIHANDNVFGETELLFELNDGIEITSETIPVSISPRNDAPGDFATITPLEYSLITEQPITFNWSESVDVDNEAVNYEIHIETSELNTVLNTLETSVVYDLSNYEGIVSWIVFSSDGNLTNSTGLNIFYCGDNESLIANFNSSVRMGILPLNIEFNDVSAGNPDSWAWDFDNDGLADSFIQNPTHTYDTPGLKTINLSVSNGTKTDEITKENFIVVFEQIDGVPVYSNLPNTIINNAQAECYNATNTITVAGSGTTVDVQSGGEATFIAGNKIIFNPGFTSHLGSYSNAYITTTGDYCSQPSPMMAQTPTEMEISLIADTKELAIENEEVRQDINIYPNPTTGEFVIDFSGDETTAEISLHNYYGMTVYTTKIYHQKMEKIDISDLPGGIYVVVISTNAEKIIRKIVKTF
jgi:PKD repeat protein